MAGRKPINSVRTSKVRTQIVLRAFEADVEQRTHSLRLIELVEQKKSEGTLPQFIAKALLNQMLSDEGIRPRSDIGGGVQEKSVSLPVSPRPEQAAPGISEKALENMAREMLAKLMGELNLQTGGASTDLLVSSTQHDQIDPPGRIGFGLDRAALNGSPQEQRVLPAATDAALTAKRSTILPDDYSLERSISEFDSAGGQRDVAPSHPKKRMGGNALKAMG